MPQRADLAVIRLHPRAPPKPGPGDPCNGCGVCCIAEPCPLGALLTGRRRGACAAVQWDPAFAGYRCGVLTEPARWAPWLPAAAVRRLASRWIAAAKGCDCDYVVAAADEGAAAPGRDAGAAG